MKTLISSLLGLATFALVFGLVASTDFSSPASAQVPAQVLAMGDIKDVSEQDIPEAKVWRALLVGGRADLEALPDLMTRSACGTLIETVSKLVMEEVCYNVETGEVFAAEK